MDDFDPVSLWDSSVSFDSLQDDHIVALLQKSFDPLVNFSDIPSATYPALTPPSEDSSPSPPTITDQSHPKPNPSRSTTSSSVASNGGGGGGGDDLALKRKASDDSFSDETPTHKNPHRESRDSDGMNSSREGSSSIATASGNKRMVPTSRRKTEPVPDHSKLLKRKEQNRAAQRAFRERKERHVKDLEDQVAALEAKNDQAASENDNLRDLLTRLQSENMRLRQNSFTFQVPKAAGAAVPYGGEQQQLQLLPPGPSSAHPTPSPNLSDLFNTTTSSTPSVAPSPPQNSVFSNDNFDWNSLMPFDPAVLTLLDDSAGQPPAMDLGLGLGLGGTISELSPRMPYTTIASNPRFMSYADAFDSNGSIDVNITAPNDANTFTYDLQSWPMSTLTPQQPITKEPDALDEFFGSNNYLTAGQNLDYNVLTGPSISPVLHSNTTPSSFQSDPSMFNLVRATTNSPLPAVASTSQQPQPVHGGGEAECPKTRAEFANKISMEGPSPFAPPAPVVQLHRMKELDDKTRAIITCQGTKGLPKAAQSDANVEVLEAWKVITSTDAFKTADIDMNELCQQFSDKARCDGTKVVLEPQGVASIIDTLSKRSKKQR